MKMKKILRRPFLYSERINKYEDYQEKIHPLKLEWLKKEVLRRGDESIISLSKNNLTYITLFDSFMILNFFEVVKEEDIIKEINELDLRGEVKEILRKRSLEFLKWKLENENKIPKEEIDYITTEIIEKLEEE